MQNTIHSKVGETFEIFLEGAAGTGFHWEFDPQPAAIRLVTLLGESREAASTVPGGRTVHRFQFQAVSPGKVDLTFHSRRAWESASAGTTQTITVQIDA